MDSVTTWLQIVSMAFVIVTATAAAVAIVVSQIRKNSHDALKEWASTLEKQNTHLESEIVELRAGIVQLQADMRAVERHQIDATIDGVVTGVLAGLGD